LTPQVCCQKKKRDTYIPTKDRSAARDMKDTYLPMRDTYIPIMQARYNSGIIKYILQLPLKDKTSLVGTSQPTIR
jgi:hypothetical protein